MRRYLFPYLTIIATLSCNPSKTDQRQSASLLSIEVGESPDSRSLKLSELMIVEGIIPLETNPDILLPGETSLRVAITNQYIVVAAESEINQFTLTGKFIRILARRGKGPKEFTGFNGFAVDRDFERLYYSDVGDRKYIDEVDLKTGEHLPGIPLPLEQLENKEGMYLSQIVVNEDHSLVCSVPSQFNSNRVVFVMTPGGKLQEGVARAGNYVLNFNDRWYYSLVDDHPYYKEPDNDTLFSLQHWQKKPAVIFHVADYHKSVTRTLFHSDMSNETTWRIAYTGLEYFIITRQAIFRWPEGAYSINDVQYVFAPKQAPSILIKSIFIDSLGYEMENFGFDRSLPFSQSGEFIIFKISADEFKQNAKEVLASGVLNPDVLERVRKLNEQVLEGDNPILVIGKIK